MLSVNVPRGATLERITCDIDGKVDHGKILDGHIPDNAVWVDLYTPTPAENRVVEQALGVALPTREEMQEIEITSRLYVEDGARYMTATLMCNSDTEVPRTTPVTFILSGHRLVTVRYDEPKPFTIVTARLARACPANPSGETVLMDLLDAVIDRSADILEKIGSDVDTISHTILESDSPLSRQDFKEILRSIGRRGDHTSKVRESLVSIGRLLLYIAAEADTMKKWAKDQRAALKGMQRDVQSLAEHATYLSQKISFLLDAMLGVVSVEQNNIIKIFSVAAVVLMPPTLIASIYGMNFKHMPELDFEFGYPVAI
ncbi:MAG: magnesium transporter CorA family protein, partial [Bradyrhizobiaceae bacterium]|nr:magnesium transporter CorA family protein [Bradyrhizobiaceae bacterium]